MEDKRFGDESVVSVEGGQIVQWSIHVGSVRGGSHSVTAAPRVRAAKNFEFGGNVVSTLGGPIWSRCSTALTCRARSHFQRIQSRERWGQGWDERYRLSRGVE